MKSILSLLTFSLISIYSFGQITQNIRGVITDKDSKLSLPGANVVITSLDPVKGAVTDIDGRFKLEEVPIGRHNIIVSFVGYENKVLQNVELTSGKELILNIELQESIMMKEVVVEAKDDKDKTINKMATVSARTFSIEETSRYAGSLNDVARMAQNFAGVQGADDSRNDIIIRGNSPIGVLYRLEDVDIPNPNHFALNGTTGGPVSMLNNNVLDNSDFMTGAFPAEYGNAIAGVFDLKLRNGNNENHEFLGQIGFNGLEFMAEGPINKEKHSSYIVNGRYSTLELFQKMGFNFGTGTAIPQYKDATFKINLPNKKGKTVFWGLGGLSTIAMLNDTDEGNNLFSEGGENLWFTSKIGATGVSNTYRLNDNSYLKTSLSIDATYNGIINDTLNTFDQNYYAFYRNKSVEGKQSFNLTYNSKINARHLIKAGVYSQRKFFNLQDSVHQRLDSIYIPFTGTYTIIEPQWRQLTSFEGATYFIQPFVQWQYRINEKTTLNTGLHSQYFTYNNTYAIEPRAGVRWKMNDNNTFSFAYGVHHQLPPTRLFFYQQTDQFGDLVYDDNNEVVVPNKNLDMIKSQHFVASYDRNLGSNTRIKVEAYYQLLDQVPVDFNVNYYSVLNYGANFDLVFPDTLINNGTGTNYGAELTIERFLNKGFYYLLTTSVYQSTYKGNDGIERNTAFNGNYTFNALAGKEFTFKPKSENSKYQSSLVVDIKMTLNGGQRYIPIDLDASNAAGRAVYDFDNAFTEQYDSYFRTDLKIGYKLNSKKITQEWSLNIQNMTNRNNIFTQTYDPGSQSISTTYQVGLLPIMQYKILF